MTEYKTLAEWKATISAMSDKELVDRMEQPEHDYFLLTAKFKADDVALEEIYDLELLRRFKSVGSTCSVCGARSTPLDGCRGTGGACVIRRPVSK